MVNDFLAIEFNQNHILNDTIFNNRMPQFLKNPIVYLIAVTIQFLMVEKFFAIVSILLSIGISSFLITMSETADTKHLLSLINKSAKSVKNRALTLKQISIFLQVDGTIKQLSICDD